MQMAAVAVLGLSKIQYRVINRRDLFPKAARCFAEIVSGVGCAPLCLGSFVAGGGDLSLQSLGPRLKFDHAPEYLRFGLDANLLQHLRQSCYGGAEGLSLTPKLIELRFELRHPLVVEPD